MVVLVEEVLVDEFIVFRQENAEIRVGVNPAHDFLSLMLFVDFFVNIVPCFMGEGQGGGSAFAEFCLHEAADQDIDLAQLLDNRTHQNSTTFVGGFIFCKAVDFLIDLLGNVDVLIFLYPLAHGENILRQRIFRQRSGLIFALTLFCSFGHVSHSNISISKS